ncbi:MAG: ATP synthase F1 subunit gamma [Saprospirales bacterium]|nr:MAG: ATP synthase F1 subunit gamma [Saprospirales bacterium]
MGANLKEVRERIASVNSTQQITKAMKMVSAAKLRKAQDAITRLRPYSQKLEEMMAKLLAGLEGDTSTVYNQKRNVDQVLMVIVTSNRGLCGAFNSNIIKAAVAKIESDYAEERNSGKLVLACIGKRGYDYFKNRYRKVKVVNDYVDLFSNLSFENVSNLTKLIMWRFEQEKYDVVDIVYGSFKNAGVQLPVVEQFLPVEVIQATEANENEDDFNADYIIEPSKEELVKEMVPTILQIQFQKCLLDTHAAEHAARMTAMDKATENANELLKDLKIHYNKARQESITGELLEIVAGADALSS